MYTCIHSERIKLMYRQLALLFLITISAIGSSIEIGSNEIPKNIPFCGSCALSLRYQTLYLEGEIGGAINIQSISLMRTPQGESHVTLDTLAIYMGYSSGAELGNNFNDNYLAGSRLLVFWEENCTINAPNANEWFQINLETPFFYDGTGNLIIEYTWPSGHDAIYNYNWTGTVARGLPGPWGATTGYTEQDCPHILLSGILSLQNETFGKIKALFSTY